MRVRRAATAGTCKFGAEEQSGEPIRRRIVELHRRIVAEPRVLQLRGDRQSDPQRAHAKVDVMFDGVDRDSADV